MPVKLNKYSPNTLDEAVSIIVNNLDDEETELIREKGAPVTHFTFGMQMRNEWGLWEENSTLAKFFKNNYQLGHADDMSGMILFGVTNTVRGGTPDYEGRKKVYHEHWARFKVDPITLEDL